MCCARLLAARTGLAAHGSLASPDSDFFAPSLARRCPPVMAVLVYLVFMPQHRAVTQAGGKGIGWPQKFLAGFFPPTLPTDIVPGLPGVAARSAFLSSLIGTHSASGAGAVLAARNLMPTGVSWVARLVIIFCRSFHPVIVAIIAVKGGWFWCAGRDHRAHVRQHWLRQQSCLRRRLKRSQKQIEAVLPPGPRS